MTKTIGIIGAGMIGSQVARLSIKAGFEVAISNSRGPQTLQPLIEELGKNARAVSADEAIAQGDIVVLAIPFGIYARLNPNQYAGKIIVDTMNYYPERDGEIAAVQTDKIASSELVQRHLPGSRLVKALSNMDFVRLYQSARPAGHRERSAVPIASDDPEAKSVVVKFLERIGYDTVDMGRLNDSWRSEPTTPVYVDPYIAKHDANLPVEMARGWFLTAPGVTVDKEHVQQLLKAATRHDQMFGSIAGTSGSSF